MTLRTRLFLFFGALIAVLASAELWLVRSLARDLDVQIDELAVSVGWSVVMAVSAQDQKVTSVRIPQRGGKRRPDEDSTASGGREDSNGADSSVIAGQTKIRSVFVLADKSLGAQGDQKKLVFEASSGLGEAIDINELGAKLSQGQWIASPEYGREASVVSRLRLPQVYDTRGQGKQILVSAPIERGGFQQAMDRFQFRLILGSAGILGLGLLIAGLVAHRVSSPLRELSRAAGEVGKGDFGVQVPSSGDSEVRQTLTAFNSMSLRLSQLDEEAKRLREGQHLSELGEVARGLAHSLRNPLHVLGLTVEGMAVGTDPALVSTARAHIERIDRTLRTLLALSSQGGEQILQVDLSSVVRDVALELLQDPACAVPTSIVAAGPVPIEGVAAELRAVLHVVMVNAAEASPSGESITVHVEAHPHGAQVRVQDQGPGLDPSIQEHLFSPHTSTKSQGAGMGLYLAQRIATNRYGGALSLAERPNGGIEAKLVLGARSPEV